MESLDDRSLLVQVLADNDVECPSCRYNLRGLTTDHCPECNQRLVLRVGLAEPRMGVYIAGLVVLAAPLGFCLIVGMWGAVLERAGSGQLLPLVAGTLALGAWTAIWIFRGRQVRRMSSQSRAGWVAAAAVFGAAIIGWFFASLR